jgi:predicted transcriptional regulator
MRRGRPTLGDGASVKTSLSIPPDLYAALARIAENEDRSVAYIIRRACERDVVKWMDAC